MKRKNDYMIRVGGAAFAALCIIVTIVAALSAMRGNATPKREENLSLPSPEPATVVSVVQEEAWRGLEKPETVPPVVTAAVNEQDMMLLAKLIACEMGCSWIGAEQKYNAGSVVLNRVADPRFPNTIYDVIWQAGQYPAAASGALMMAEPSEEIIAIARDLLTNGSRLPADVVWQAEFKQGNGVYTMYYDKVLGTTTYYCY